MRNWHSVPGQMQKRRRARTKAMQNLELRTNTTAVQSNVDGPPIDAFMQSHSAGKATELLHETCDAQPALHSPSGTSARGTILASSDSSVLPVLGHAA